jgi:hypothetical protein
LITPQSHGIEIWTEAQLLARLDGGQSEGFAGEAE